MGWIPKNPRRPDFCGCPPCPLCFVYVDERPAERPQQVLECAPVSVDEPQVAAEPAPPAVVDGIVQMARELLGRDPMPAELAQLTGAAERIHIGNLQSNAERDRMVAEADTRRAEERVGMVAQAIIDQKLQERARPAPPKPLNTKNLDNMDPEEFRKKTAIECPVDSELLQRERQAMSAYLRARREEEIRKQREAELAYRYDQLFTRGDR